MKRKELLVIAEHFSAYDIQFSDNGERFDIINPFGKDPIYVCVENDPKTPYMVCFSFNHVHLETPDQVIAYIGDIIGGNQFTIGFFKNGRQRIGGNLNAEEVRAISYNVLTLFVRSFPDVRLIDVADSIKVRGWAQDGDFDATFGVDEMGNVSIQIIEVSVNE